MTAEGLGALFATVISSAGAGLVAALAFMLVPQNLQVPVLVFILVFLSLCGAYLWMYGEMSKGRRKP